MEGIINTLVFKQKVYTASSLVTRTEKWRARKACKCDCAELRKIASRSVRGVEKDMQELLRVNEVSILFVIRFLTSGYTYGLWEGFLGRLSEMDS